MSQKSKPQRRKELPDVTPNANTFRGTLSLVDDAGTQAVDLHVYAAPTVSTAQAFIASARVEAEAWLNAGIQADPGGMAFVVSNLANDSDD